MKQLFRLLAFASAVALVALFCFFPRQLMVAYGQFKLHSFCKKNLKATLTVGRVDYLEDEIAIYDIHIVRPHHFDLTITKATLAPHFDFRAREFIANLDVDELTLLMQKRDKEIFVSPPVLSMPLLTFNVHSKVHRGQLLLYDYRSHKRLFQSLSFELDSLYKSDSVEGAVLFSSGESPQWQVSYARERGGSLTFTSTFHEHSCPHISDFMFYFFDGQLPAAFGSWRVDSGTIEGELIAKFQEQKLSYLSGDLLLQKVALCDPSDSFEGNLDYLRADFTLDLLEGCDQWTGSFALGDGNLALKESEVALWRTLFDISHLNAHLVIDDGKVVSSLIGGSLMGMEGRMEVDFDAPEKMMRAYFQGSVSQIAPFLPPSLQQAFTEGFLDEEVLLHANVKRVQEGISLAGNITIDDRDGLDFGCHFKKEILPCKLEELPSLLPRELTSFLGNMKSQFYLNNKRVGWLRGKGLALEKYLSPFLFKNTRFGLTGLVDVEATFDEKGIVFFYEGKNFQLDSPHLQVSVDKVAERCFTDIVALHYIDLETLEHKGFLPIKGGYYTQKNVALPFTDCEGLLYFENNTIAVKNLSASSLGVAFSGELLLEMHNSNDVDLYLETDSIKGTLPEARDFLSHIVPNAIWQLPVAGNVLSKKRGCSLHFHFAPQVTLKKVSCKGELCGSYKDGFVELTDIKSHFSYDREENQILFTNNVALYKSPLHKTPYHLACPEFSLSSFPKPLVELTCKATGADKVEHTFSAKSREDQVIEICGDDFAGELLLGDCVHCAFTKGQLKGSGSIKKEGSTLVIEEAMLSHKERGEILFGGYFDLGRRNFTGRATRVFCEQLLPEGMEVEASGDLIFDAKSKECILQVEKATFTRENREIPLSVAEFRYKLPMREFIVDTLAFSLTEEELALVEAHLADMQLSPLLTSERRVKGFISCALGKRVHWADVALEEGNYLINNKNYFVHDITLHYLPSEVSIYAQTTLFSHPSWLKLTLNPADQESLSLAISDREVARFDPLTSFMTKWQREEGWRFVEGEGTLFGFIADIRANDAHLTGHIEFEPRDCQALLPKPLAHFLEKNEIRGRYLLEGSYSYAENAYEGTLSGKECSFASVKCNNVACKIKNYDKLFEFSEITCLDWAGALTCARAVYDSEHQYLTLADLTIEKLRFSRLRSKWTNPSNRCKFLVIPDLKIKHFEADLQKPDSYLSEGDFSFTNLPRRTFLNQLLTLPVEITARLGLDVANLIPVRGRVHFEVKDKKILLHEFNEMYSEGKRSLFYLANQTPSYIDFEGNLNIHIKMKQYTLLMKLAEFFTLSVKGTIKNPRYHFVSGGGYVE